jgi:hypothetical protein
MFSSVVTISTSIGSSAVVFAVNLLWNVLTSKDATIVLMCKFGIGISVVAAGIAFIIALWAYRSRGSELEKILAEARTSGL